MRPILVVLAALACLLPSPPAAGAQAGWTADLSAGYVTYRAAAARIGTGSMIGGVRYLGTEAGWGYLYGGAPLEREGVFWGAAGAGRRLATPLGPATLGLDLGAHGLGYRDQVTRLGGSSLTVEALPLILLQRGALAVQLRSGLLQNTDFFPDTTQTRRIHDTALNLLLTPAAGVLVGADARLARAPEDANVYLGASAEMARGPLRAWGAAGRWLSDTLPTPAFGAGVGLQARRGWEVSALWQQETYNPLFRNLPRQTWTVQLSRRLGRIRDPLPLSPAVVPRDADGRVVIRFPAGEASATPSLIGEMTGWRPVPMTAEDGHWVVRIAVEPGVYRYGFHDEAGRWFLPRSVTHRVDDGMGGTSAVLVVP